MKKNRLICKLFCSANMVGEWNPPLGDLEEMLVKSGEVIGNEMESWVVENEARFDLSSSRSGQESLALGHSSKKGRRDWVSCFAGSVKLKSLPNKEWTWRCRDCEGRVTWPIFCSDWSWGYAFCRREESCNFDSEIEDDRDVNCVDCHELSVDESTPRTLALSEASVKRLCSSAPVLRPAKYLKIWGH